MNQRTPLALVVFVLASALLCLAQMTVLNVPSADVLDKGKAYVRIDQTYAPTPALYTLTPNLIYGLGHNVDVSLNVESFSHNGHGFITESFVPGFKYRFWSRTDSRGEGLVAYVGDKLYLPVHNKSFSAGNYLYLAGALQLDSGTRLTAGVYNQQNAFALGNRSGALLGFEQSVGPLGRDAQGTFSRYVAAYDWQSGKAMNGVSTFGLMIYPKRRLMIIPSYQLGNFGVKQGNHQAVLYIGYQLN